MVSPSKRKHIREQIPNEDKKNLLKTNSSYKPLSNKKFYLDLPNYNCIQKLKLDIIHLGGVIEQFLVKEVNYVVTNRNLSSSNKGSSSDPSSLPLASPNTPFSHSPITHLPSTSCLSPHTDSPREGTKKKAKTRAELLLERACVKRQGTSDILENARLWNLPVWSLSKLLRWLAALKESRLYQPPKSLSSSKSKSAQVQASKNQKLKVPFVKVEGFSRQHRPHFKKLERWPLINFESKGSSPFDFSDSTVEAKVLSPHKENYQNKKTKGKQLKEGYCELCISNYTNLTFHLQSDSHLEFVNNRSNYTLLDELVAEYEVENLGETLYSGPAALAKSGFVNHVNSVINASSTAATQQEKESPIDDGSVSGSPDGIDDSQSKPESTLVFDLGIKVNGSQSHHDVRELKGKDLASDFNLEDPNTRGTRSFSSLLKEKSETKQLKVKPAEMVRLIQEPVSKVDPQSLRRGMRAPKRIQSVDGIDLSDKNDSRKTKSGIKELRNRSVSCGSDPSDSELSDVVTNNGIKVNGQVNGVSKIKAGSRISRSNSDDSSDSLIAPKLNGVEFDNDHMDINLLLEISPKDRKIFETKKAKIKRKCADWMLITETEQYYNEKEEILRNKTREETDSESEPEIQTKSEYCSDTKSKKGKKPARKSDKKATDAKAKSKPTKSKKNDISPEEDESDQEHYEDDQSKPRSGKKQQKPRKRLSDAERFLRDNREYYQFPETRDRLRKVTTQSKEKSPKCPNAQISEKKLIVKETKQSPPKVRCSKTKTKRRSTESETPVEPPEETGLDSLYFSFEGPPVKESWYQTYQRYIDGIQEDSFHYQKEAFRFVLPYEMSKEYFKELHGRKYLLSRRKSELAELVRKSPRCHASTLALFSDIFPGKKKRGVKGVKVATEEASSDGTSTPNLNESLMKLPFSDSTEVDEDFLFINQCMDHILKSPTDISEAQEEETKTKKSKDPKKKKKVKSRKVVSSPLVKVEKYEFPPEVKLFDNSLATEIDLRFLQELPQYLREVSIVPQDTLEKSPLDLLTESYHCECTERTSCDEFSSADDRTEASSESLSVCDSETVDSSNSSFPSKYRKFGSFKKRRKNLTGWPTQKRKRPAPSQVSDDNDSCAGLDEPKKRTRPKCSESLRRASTRKRSSVYYMDTWPVRFRHNK